MSSQDDRMQMQVSTVVGWIGILAGHEGLDWPVSLRRLEMAAVERLVCLFGCIAAIEMDAL